ncbi:putative Ubiquitin-like domain-containing protein [Helianthus debilis subsp. tardiflorus]
MKIFIKTLTRDQTITLEVKPSYTIHDIKAKIQDEVHIPPDDQELIFNKMVLHNTDTLASYSINNKSTLTVMRISWGFMRIFIKTLSGKMLNPHLQLAIASSTINPHLQDGSPQH